MGLDHVPPLAPKRGRARPELDPVDEDGEDEEDEGFGQVDDPELPELAESEEMTVGERADMGLLSAADTMNQGAKLLGKVKETIANPGKLLAKLKNASQTGFQKAEKLDDIDGVKPVSIFSLGGAMKDSPVGKLVKDKMEQLGKFAGTLIDDSPFRGLKTSATSIQKKLNDPKTKKVAQTMSSPEKKKAFSGVPYGELKGIMKARLDTKDGVGVNPKAKPGISLAGLIPKAVTNKIKKVGKAVVKHAEEIFEKELDKTAFLELDEEENVVTGAYTHENATHVAKCDVGGGTKGPCRSWAEMTLAEKGQMNWVSKADNPEGRKESWGIFVGLTLAGVDVGHWGHAGVDLGVNIIWPVGGGRVGIPYATVFIDGGISFSVEGEKKGKFGTVMQGGRKIKGGKLKGKNQYVGLSGLAGMASSKYKNLGFGVSVGVWLGKPSGLSEGGHGNGPGRAGNIGISFPSFMVPSQFVPDGFTVTISDPIGKPACGVPNEIMGFSLDWTIGEAADNEDGHQRALLSSAEEFDEHYERQRLGEDLRLTPEEMEQGATRKRVRSHIEKKRRERHLRRQAAQLRNSMRRKDALGESTHEAFSFGRPLTAVQSHGVRGKKRSLLSIDEPFERPLDDTSPLGNYELGEVAHALKKDATANARLVNKATKQSKTIVKQNKAFQQQKAKEDIKKKKADKAAADKQKKAADKAAKDKKKAADKAAKDKKKAADKQKKAADKAAKDKKKKADKAAKDKKKAAD